MENKPKECFRFGKKQMFEAVITPRGDNLDIYLKVFKDNDPEQPYFYYPDFPWMQKLNKEANTNGLSHKEAVAKVFAKLAEWEFNGILKWDNNLSPSVEFKNGT